MHARFLFSALLLSTLSVGCSKSGTDTSKTASAEATSDPSAVSEQADVAQADVAQANAEQADADMVDDASNEPVAGEAAATEESASVEVAPPATVVETPAKPVRKISADAFRMAAHDGRLDLVRSGIEQGMDVNEADPGQQLTALHMAAYNGHTETVQYLIANGAVVDCRDSTGKTPLSHACTGPFAKSVAALIEAGADVNAKDSGEGFTPLMMAAGLGEPEVVRILLKNGADKTILDEDRESAVDHARNSGHSNIVSMLE